MPTGNRKLFVFQAIRYFHRQDYPARELLVLDDGTEDLSSEIAGGNGIRYLRLPAGLTIGAKRNRGCELALGTIIAHWDDDDWYAASRLSSQVAPLITGTAEISAFSDCLFLDLPKWRFWRCSPQIFRRMFVGDVHGGTLVFQRSLFEQGIRYPDESLAEDASFLYRCNRRGARLQRIPGDDLFIYLRHSKCAWKFDCGEHINPRGWHCVPEPHLSPEDRNFLESQSGELRESL